MLKKIYQELVLIRKELQSIRSDLEFRVKTSIDGNRIGGGEMWVSKKI